jgi:hypothetical protein
MPAPATSPRSRLGALRAQVGEALFPGELARESRFGRLEAAVLVAALLLLAIVLDLLRLGLSTSLTTVWAEDGPIYLQASLTQGFWHAIASAYAGYLVLVPRLIAEIATLVPLRYAPAAVSIVSAACAALSGLAVWFASGGHVHNPYLRGTLVALTVLAPAAGTETLVSAAYVPWYMLFASFWLLIWRPATMAGAVLAGIFIALTALSTPGVWFFAPVAALRLFAARDRRDLTVVGFYALGSAVQAIVVLGQEQGEPLWTSDIWKAFVQRVLDGGTFGQRLGGDLWSEFGWPFLIVLIAALLVAVVVGFRRATPGARWFAALALPTSLVMFVVSAYQRTVGSNLIWSAGESGGTASRYVLVPALLLVSALLVLLDAALRRHNPRARPLSWAVGATVALMAVAIIVSFDASDPVRQVPHWEDSLEVAAAKCASAEEALAGIATSPEPFGVQIPCEQLLADRR